MKRAAAATGVRRSKKSKLVQKSAGQQLINDAITSVLSQSQPAPTGYSDSADIDELLNKSFTQDALDACNNLRAQTTELTGIVRQQRDKMKSMDQKLSTVLSMLKTVLRIRVRLHQPGLDRQLLQLAQLLRKPQRCQLHRHHRVTSRQSYISH